MSKKHIVCETEGYQLEPLSSYTPEKPAFVTGESYSEVKKYGKGKNR